MATALMAILDALSRRQLDSNLDLFSFFILPARERERPTDCRPSFYSVWTIQTIQNLECIFCRSIESIVWTPYKVLSIAIDLKSRLFNTH